MIEILLVIILLTLIGILDFNIYSTSFCLPGLLGTSVGMLLVIIWFILYFKRKK